MRSHIALLEALGRTDCCRAVTGPRRPATRSDRRLTVEGEPERGDDGSELVLERGCSREVSHAARLPVCDGRQFRQAETAHGHDGAQRARPQPDVRMVRCERARLCEVTQR